MAAARNPKDDPTWMPLGLAAGIGAGAVVGAAIDDTAVGIAIRIYRNDRNKD
ncbi:hypothetical protein [Luteimonas suaedae]|uniref:hypothetical protein n=1 Tax=Luteimonas suaedae TaxID=2605430 RepID=UPI001659EA43|nr:hypothetical protein [Luteimonas suaedae]